MPPMPPNLSRPNRRAANGDDIAKLADTLGSRNGLERQHAREALIALGEAAIPALIAALGDERVHVRWEAAKAFTVLPVGSAAEALVGALEDEDGDIRWLAAEALTTMKRHGLEALLGALIQRSDSVWLREGAHHVLHSLRETDLKHIAAPVLTALENYAPDLAVPFAAEQALNTLGTVPE